MFCFASTIYQYFTFGLLVSKSSHRQTQKLHRIQDMERFLLLSFFVFFLHSQQHLAEMGKLWRLSTFLLLQCEGLAGQSSCSWDTVCSHGTIDSSNIADMHVLLVIPTHTHGMLTCLISLS